MPIPIPIPTPIPPRPLNNPSQNLHPPLKIPNQAPHLLALNIHPLSISPPPILPPRRTRSQTGSRTGTGTRTQRHTTTTRSPPNTNPLNPQHHPLPPAPRIALAAPAQRRRALHLRAQHLPRGTQAGGALDGGAGGVDVDDQDAFFGGVGGVWAVVWLLGGADAGGGEEGAGVVVGEEVVRGLRVDGGVCGGVVDEGEEGGEGGRGVLLLLLLLALLVLGLGLGLGLGLLFGFFVMWMGFWRRGDVGWGIGGSWWARG